MTEISSRLYTAFNNYQRIMSGSLNAVAVVVRKTIESGRAGQILIFDDTTGRSIDIDLRNLEQEETFSKASSDSLKNDVLENVPRGPGRPKLGVISREVTMLPRHWEWLNAQPGGASVALRKLVEEARRTHAEKDKSRKAKERAYHFMSAMAGDMPNFEEATRALFAENFLRLRELISEWPEDVRAYVLFLALENHE